MFQMTYQRGLGKPMTVRCHNVANAVQILLGGTYVHIVSVKEIDNESGKEIRTLSQEEILRAQATISCSKLRHDEGRREPCDRKTASTGKDE